MVKAYLRYEPSGAFGVITSGVSPVYDAAGTHIITASLERVAVWSIKQGSLVRKGRQGRRGGTSGAGAELRAPANQPAEPLSCGMPGGAARPHGAWHSGAQPAQREQHLPGNGVG